MIQTLNLNGPAPSPNRAMEYLDGDTILLGAYQYLEKRYYGCRDEEDAMDILIRCHVYISDAFEAALGRNYGNDD